ncbi:S1C family serine protease [Novosphingobium sp. Gsoil 351]|uniref:S1C family serine protease n=1 Tax=Novosphingobium sp. Gsoil 351 TaxID=2675225 RepID=UPI0012B4C49F|nr:serine protease [Novosphingobium sp. Gsoil 351]QGN53498.1 trypsin-like serine protease [Novosphingobium sp. Gsoil 351]
MTLILRLLIALASLAAAPLALAEPADIAAASRGVVRVVLVAKDGESVQYVGHGSGFAVTPTLVVTNAHVVADARNADTMLIGVVPSEGTSGYLAKVIAYSPRNDLALLRLIDKGTIPALTLFPGAVDDGSEVYAVGYPGNVDLAQGLSLAEIVEPQSAVKTRGYISAGRSSRQFETLLHTAPVGSGNSGGPLLDSCGRVIGVNSFGTLSEGADSEFYFAVSLREVIGFLREAGVTPRIAGMPCRSLAELDRAESQRLASEQAQSDAQARRQSAAGEKSRAEAQRRAELAVIAERENAMALAALLLVAALAAGGVAFVVEQRGDRRMALIAGGAGVALVLVAIVAWLLRPPLESIDERAAASLSSAEPRAAAATSAQADAGAFVCVFDPARSRATVSEVADVQLAWSAGGCVNGRTQYGLANDGWSRVLAPNDEATVSVNRYDPATRTYQAERFLLGLEAMNAARDARSAMKAPACGVDEATAREFGAGLQSIKALLPPHPNERLVYKCQPR